MGALAAILSKDGGNVVPHIVEMLNALKHRGSDFFSISTDKKTAVARNINDLSDSILEVRSSIAIGYSCSRMISKDKQQPIEINGFKLVFDGRIFSPHIGGDEICRLFERSKSIEETLKNIVEADGSIVFTALEGNKLLAGREATGALPLYFCDDARHIALASERKALWRLNVEDEKIRSFPPGSIAEINDAGIMFQQVKVLERRKEENAGREEELVEELCTLLSNSIKERVYGLEGGVSIAFSGGLDSSVIAALMRKQGVNALLISVGLEGSRELEHAEKIAEEINLPFRSKVYTAEDVERTLPVVLWLIEEASALKASIHIPEFWATELSSRMGCRAIFFGHGADELFGGYFKYLGDYGKSFDETEKALYSDTLRLHENSLEPSEKICAFHNLEAIFPYADYDLAEFALSLPVTLKISSEKDPLRKRILRKLAERIGLPAEVYLRPKKAIQYGTGVSKALRKISKRNGLDTQSFINQIFRRITGLNEDSNSLLT